MRPFLVTFYRTVKVIANKELEAERLAKEEIESDATGHVSLYSMEVKIVDINKKKVKEC